MKTQLKAVAGLLLFILLTSSLTLIALARISNENHGLLRNDDVSLTPGEIGLLATTIIVNTSNEELNNDGDCSLREALRAARTDTAVDACPAGSGNNDTIFVPPDTYFLTDPFLTDLDITFNVTIQGAGAETTIIANTLANERVIDIDNTGVVTISGVTITGGDHSSGGGIRNLGTLVLINSVVSNNEANNRGGGIFNDGGVLTVSNSTITGNEANVAGGGIFNEDGTIIINNSTISLNSATADSAAGVGGGIANSAENSNANLTVNQSMILNNTVKGAGGGGISNRADANHTATVTLNQVEVNNNLATATKVISTTGVGGGILNGFFDNANSSAAAILSVNNSTVSGNTAFNGGGIASNNVLPTNPTLMATLNNSTVSGNRADGLTSPEVVGNGGGIVNQDGTMNLVNSTISGNTATGGIGIVRGLGGGLSNSSFNNATTLWLTNTTITGNTASIAGAALANVQISTTGATVNFENSIIAGGCSNGIPNFPITAGTLTSNDHNLDDGNSCNLVSGNDITNGNPLLGPLQDNGGDTKTHALLAGSPAIDAGNNATCPATDQRGRARPVDSDDNGTATCDIGAYEAYLIRVVKLANVSKAYLDEIITYTYWLTNTSNVNITSISASDDKLGNVPLGLTTLTPGQETTGILTHTVITSDLPGPLINTVIIAGTTQPRGTVVTDTDNVTVNVFIPLYLPIMVKNHN